MSNSEQAAREILHAFLRHSKSRGRPPHLLASMFEAYRKNVMPPGASAVQVLECKRAFFGGAHSLIDLMFAASDDGEEITLMEAIEEEGRAYMAEGQMRGNAAVVAAKGRA